MVQQLVMAILYYLSVMCVAKYKGILDAVAREDRDTTSESTNSPESGSTAERSSLSFQRFVDREGSLDSTTEFKRTIVGVEQSITPPSLMSFSKATDLSEQIEATLKLVGPFLCQLLVEQKGMLSKVLVAADGRHLLTDGMC